MQEEDRAKRNYGMKDKGGSRSFEFRVMFCGLRGREREGGLQREGEGGGNHLGNDMREYKGKNKLESIHIRR